MKIEQIIKSKNKEVYDKLIKFRCNYKECMKRKCKDCKNKKECFKEEEI